MAGTPEKWWGRRATFRDVTPARARDTASARGPVITWRSESWKCWLSEKFREPEKKCCRGADGAGAPFLAFAAARLVTQTTAFAQLGPSGCNSSTVAPF